MTPTQLAIWPDDPIDAIPGLRDYQAEALRAVRDAAARGVRRQLVVLPTGAGKSHCLRNVPSVLGWRRTLAVVHRIELVSQLAHHFQEAYPDARVGIERADQYASLDDDVVVACTATLNKARLGRWPSDHFDGLIHDESHRGLANSHVRIFRHFGCQDPDGPLWVGCTATPFRGDGQPLANLADEIVYSRGIREMIEAGWLCRLRAQRVRTDVDLGDMHVKYGEFQEKELAELTNTSGRNSLVVSAIENHCKDRRSILVFATNVEHVESLVYALKNRGHSAASILGHTDPVERVSTLQDFHNGLLRILVSCGCLSEGVDVPRTDCVVMARPWRSPLGFIQQLGRGLRPHPEKRDLLVIDIVDNVGRHQVQTAIRLFGVRDVDCLGQDVLDVAKRVEAVTEEGIALVEGETIDAVEERADKLNRIAKGVLLVHTVAESVDIFASNTIDERVRDSSLFPWIGVGKDRWVLSVGGGAKVRLEGDVTGAWKVWSPECVAELGVHSDIPWREADRAVKRFVPDFWRVKMMSARWRNDPASEKQRAALMRMGFKALPPRLTKGAASDMFDVIGSRKERGAVR